jgi:ribosomal protein S18 acetylase RimI-like enzyme
MFLTMSAPDDNSSIEIRDPTTGDEAEWRRLWAGYNEFYESKVEEPVTAATWRRLLLKSDGLFGRIAVYNGAVVGFAACVLHAGTWTQQPICYLEDLFVDPALRGKGIGEALIDDLIARAQERGWSRLYWHTRANNAVARRLYDKFVMADDFVRYRIVFSQ